MAITLADVERAHDVIRTQVRNTPMKRSGTLSDATGANLHLKLENFQRTGSFKVRGGLNKIHSLSEAERRVGVVAASAGNHAQGVAYAATQAGVTSDVFMPEDATIAKVIATKGYGANVHLIGSDYQEAFEAAREYCHDRGATFVHAFDDPFIMAGQGTIGLEVLHELPNLQEFVIPIGGGGLIGGIATAVKAINPDCRIIGVQAEGASTVAPSLDKGHVVPLETVSTMADGIACRTLGSLTFAAIQNHVDEVVTVSESEIAQSILHLLERTKTLVEGAGAVSLAAALHRDLNLQGDACVLVSGGNIDMTLVSRILQRGLVKEGRIAVIDTLVPDRPGQISRLLELVALHKGNVLDIRHHRLRSDIPLYMTGIELHLETRGAPHIQKILEALHQEGFQATVSQ